MKADFPITGDEGLHDTAIEALHRVIDPEMALDIVELGLVYGVELGPKVANVTITMTSAACPVAEFIIDEVRHELGRALGGTRRVDVKLVWDPPWTPQRMSDSARRAMAWD